MTAPLAARQIRLELPWPPSANRYWRAVPARRRDCRMILSREGRAYRDRVDACLAGERPPLQGRLHVRITLHAPSHRRIDIDNRIKSLLDALEHAGVYEDDEQIDRLAVGRGIVRRPGSAIVEIVEAPG